MPLIRCNSANHLNTDSMVSATIDGDQLVIVMESGATVPINHAPGRVGGADINLVAEEIGKHRGLSFVQRRRI